VQLAQRVPPARKVTKASPGPLAPRARIQFRA
jgi:hypothetical protein